jgi:hypothetical protein
LKSIDAGHHHVHQDKVGRIGPNEPECTSTIVHGPHVVVVRRQERREQPAAGFGVIDDQYVAHRLRPRLDEHGREDRSHSTRVVIRGEEHLSRRGHPRRSDTCVSRFSAPGCRARKVAVTQGVSFGTDSHVAPTYGMRMATVSLATFISEHRDALIGLCRARVSTRSGPAPLDGEIDHSGVPLLLTQLCRELSRSGNQADHINESARAHGHDLLVRGFSIDQVVRDYGDVCQSVTELAIATNTAISVQEFRTLNRCLDDAIAGAVMEFAKEQDRSLSVELRELWGLVNAASAAFDVLQSGSVGVDGSTGAVVRRSIEALQAYVGRREASASRAAGAMALTVATNQVN